jgi:hypothetical protein
MPAKHNITVESDLLLLKKVRLRGSPRHQSQRLLADELRKLMADDTRYAAARRRPTALLRTSVGLGHSSFVVSKKR